MSTIRTYDSPPYSDFYTQNHETRAGSLEMIIHGAHYNVVGTQEGYIEIADIGDIKYEFDVPDNEEDPRSIRVNAGSLEVTLWDQVKWVLGDDYTSLHETLYNADSFQFPYEVTLNITRDGTTYSFLMQFDIDDIDYDFVTRKVKLNLSVASNVTGDLPTLMVDYVDASNPDTYESYEGQIGGTNIYDDVLHAPAYPLLEDALDELNPAIDKELSSSVFEPANLDTEVTFWLFRNHPSTNLPNYRPFDNNEMTIIDQMALMAALEGAFYGHGFGKSFYINRQIKDAGYEKSIDFDSIEDLEIIERRNTSLAYVEANVLKWWFNDPAIDYNDFNDEFVSVSQAKTFYNSVKNDKFFAANFSLGAMDVMGLTDEIDGTKYVTFTDENNKFANFDSDRQALYDALSSNSVPAYAAAVGASKPLRIKLTGWDIFSLRPYEWFNFTGTDVPSILQGLDFRISEISYNMKNDKYEAEAYAF